MVSGNVMEGELARTHIEICMEKMVDFLKDINVGISVIREELCSMNGVLDSMRAEFTSMADSLEKISSKM